MASQSAPPIPPAQLTRVTTPDLVGTYFYRADGFRLFKIVNGVRTTHVWDRGQIVLETGTNNTVVTNRFNRCVTGRLIRSENHGWYLHDARGSVVQRTNAQGNVLRNYRYTAFGVELGDNASDICPFRFTGEHFDLSSGIITEDADWSFHSTQQQILRPCGTNGDVLILQTPPSGVFSVAQTRALGLSTNTTYVLEFYYWADYDGELLQADMAANVPAGQQTRVSFSNVESNILSFTANRTVQKARIELESADEVISLAFLRFMCPPTSNGRIFVSNVRLYNKETVEHGLYLDWRSADQMDNVIRFTHAERRTLIKPNTGRPVDGFELRENPISGSGISLVDMNLEAGATYVLQFDYWSDMPDGFMHVSNHLTWYRIVNLVTQPTVQRARVEFVPDAESVRLLFGYIGTGSAYISNILLYRLDDYGRLPVNTNPWRFNSMYWDSHTQTYYTPNRHYNPRTGRWLSPDPHWDIRTNAIFGDSPTIRNDRNVPSIHAILQAGNLYAFVMHNPVRWIDPLGLFAEDKNPADKKIEDATHGALAPRDPRTRRVFRLGSGRGTSGGGRSNASGGGNTTGGRVSSVRDSGRRFVGRITGRGTATTNQAPVANTQAPVNTAVQAPAATSNIAPQRGVGGVGWRGDATWRGNVNTIGSGGTITNLNGRMDCQHILRQKR